MVFVFSTTCHEAAHAWAALRLGDETAYRGGQVTLNPLPHVKREPFGMLIVPLLSFAMNGWMLGWASAPYDPQWALRYPKRSALMAAAGPLANLTIALACAAAIWGGLAGGIFTAPESAAMATVTTATAAGTTEAIATLLSVGFSLNLLLFAFNLIPAPPLDGSAVILLALPQDKARSYMTFLMTQPMMAMIGLLVAWRLMDVFFNPLFLLGLKLLYPSLSYG